MDILKRVEIHPGSRQQVVCPARPGKELQTELDDRRVERVDSAIEILQETVFVVQRLCPSNQPEREILIDSPWSMLVGVGECGP